MEALKKRLDIFVGANMLSDENYEKIIQFMERLTEEHGLVLTEENAAAFITHLVGALERISKDELVETMDDTIFEEVRASPAFDRAMNVLETAHAVLGMTPESEQRFILLHTCVLIEAQKEL